MRSLCALVILLLPLATGAFAQSGDASGLHVVSIGAGSPKIIVLHGGPGLRHNYLRPEWDVLAELGTVVYYDQRGCGSSTRLGPHSWTQHVEDLRNVVAMVSPEEPIVLAGSSWGSLLALLFTHSYPDRVSALILSGLVPWSEPERHQEIFESLPAEDRAMYEDLRTRPISSDMVYDSVEVASSPGIHPLLAPRVGESCTGAGRSTSLSLRHGVPSDRLAGIGQPVLVVTGPLMYPSDRAGAEAIAQLLPNAEVVDIADTGHNPWVERPDDFFLTVRRFVQRHVTRSSGSVAAAR